MRPIYFIDLSWLKMLTHLGSCVLLVAQLLEQLNEPNSICSWAEEARTQFTLCVLWVSVYHQKRCVFKRQRETELWFKSSSFVLRLDLCPLRPSIPPSETSESFPGTEHSSCPQLFPNSYHTILSSSLCIFITPLPVQASYVTWNYSNT